MMMMIIMFNKTLGTVDDADNQYGHIVENLMSDKDDDDNHVQ
jgi:hypothetical protein